MVLKSHCYGYTRTLGVNAYAIVYLLVLCTVLFMLMAPNEALHKKFWILQLVKASDLLLDSGISLSYTCFASRNFNCRLCGLSLLEVQPNCYLFVHNCPMLWNPLHTHLLLLYPVDYNF